MKARYIAECSACRGVIEVGARIQRHPNRRPSPDDGHWCHRACVEGILASWMEEAKFKEDIVTSPILTRRRWLIMAIATTGALAIACSSPAPKPTAAPKLATPPMPASQVMNWFAQSSQGGFFAALKNGSYEARNIKMENVQGGPQIAAVPLIASGKHTFGMGAGDQVLSAREEGIPLVAVFGTFQVNPSGLMYHASHPVKDFADLNGRRVYVSGAGTIWRFLASKYKLDKAQQFQYNGQLATFLADETNVFQCFVSSEPVILKRQGKDVGYLLVADAGFQPYGNAMACTERTIKEQPELVQAYVTASLQGWRDYMANPTPTLEYIRDKYNKDYDLAIAPDVFAVEKGQLLTGKDGYDPKKVGLMTDARWKDLYGAMRDVGVLTKDQDYRTAFDARFIERAHKELG